MARQAITTKYIGPTNTKPGRIKATCQARSKMVAWDHGLDVTQNHAEAAMVLADSLGWNNPNAGFKGTWHMGWDHHEHGVHVYVEA